MKVDSENSTSLDGGYLVEQAIDLDVMGRFHKAIRPVKLDCGGLRLVWKRAAERNGGSSLGAVILLHGYAQNRYAWHLSRRSFSNYLADAGFDVFNLDFRGAGRSRELGTACPQSIDDYVEGDLPRVVEDVCAATGEKKVFLVGHSLGGAVSCAFAGIAPERVRGIVTIAGLYGFAARNRMLRLLGRAAQALESFGVAPYLLPDPLPTDLVGRILHLSRRAWDHRLARLLPVVAWAPGSIEPDILGEAIHRSFEPASRGVTLSIARMACGASFCDGRGRSYFDAFEERREIPLLVLAGCGDALIAPDDARTCYDRSRSTDKTIRCLDSGDGGFGWGHIDLIMGRGAPRHSWPLILGWLRAR
jgi:polyhydroxyalkanoate synthase subunit PhaC